MTATLLAEQARTARMAGLTTLLELQILAILAHRGEATFVSVGHQTGLSIEMIAHTCASLAGRKLIHAPVCRDCLDFTLASLTDTGRKAAKAILDAGTPVLRSKSLTPTRP